MALHAKERARVKVANETCVLGARHKAFLIIDEGVSTNDDITLGTSRDG